MPADRLGVKHQAVAPKYGEQLRKPVYSLPWGYSIKRPDDGEQIMSPAAVRAARHDQVAWDNLPEALPIPKEES